MRFSPKTQAKKFVASDECTVWEYDLGSSKTNGAVAEINGWYPLSGWAVNEKCDELVYVISGAGKLLMPKPSISLHEGDTALIEADEQFAWHGKQLVIFIPCFPAWQPEQHKLFSEGVARR